MGRDDSTPDDHDDDRLDLLGSPDYDDSPRWDTIGGGTSPPTMPRDIAGDDVRPLEPLDEPGDDGEGSPGRPGWVVPAVVSVVVAGTVAALFLLFSGGDSTPSDDAATIQDADADDAVESPAENAAEEDASDDDAEVQSRAGEGSESGQVVEAQVTGECGNNLGFDNEQRLPPTPETQFDTATILFGAAGSPYLVSFPTRFYGAEGERWDDVNTEEGNFSNLQFRVYVGPADRSESAARYQFSRFTQPGDARLTFLEVASGNENNPPPGVFGQPPDLLTDGFGFSIEPLTIPDDWVVHGVEFSRYVAPLAGQPIECIIGFFRDEQPDLDPVFGGLVGRDDPGVAGLDLDVAWN